MRVPTFLKGLAAMFQGQRPPAASADKKFADEHPLEMAPDRSKPVGRVLFPWTPKARARVNQDPSNGHGHYMAQNHQPVISLSRRLGRLAGIGDALESDLANGKRRNAARAKLRPVQFAIGALVARAAHEDEVAMRRARRAAAQPEGAALA